MNRCYTHLSSEERGTIMALKCRGESMRGIAAVLNRETSTISRELRRNGYKGPAELGPMGRPRIAGGYDATRAGIRARKLRRRPRVRRKLYRGGALWATVRRYLKQLWSPEQIAGALGRKHLGQPHLHVSHETIYTAIYAYPRGELRRELVMLLRQHRCARRPRSRGTDRRGNRGRLHNILSIHVRPPEANDRLLPGHWEGDFIKGARNQSAVGTLVDRKTLFVMLARMLGGTAQAALEGFSAAFAPLDESLCKTLTYDQGKEMALHEQLTLRTGMQVYFADPHSPWQRGLNENTNGLLRQYLPKGTDLSQISQRQLDRIAWELNTRPRKSLGFRTPAEVFFEHCYEQKIAIPPGVALGP